jgi:plasmid replication initiation protein
MTLVLKGNKAELKKHINAIHCSNILSLVQRKLFNALLFNAYPELPHQSRYSISTKELCHSIGYNSNDIKRLKQALRGMVTTAIEWNVIESNTGEEAKWKASSVLASVELSDGLCLYEYTSLMRELFFQPEIYGRIDMSIIGRFKSAYGLALYENCIRYQGLSQTPWFQYDVFRALMGVGEKYDKFNQFKKRVLDPAINDVNCWSTLKIIPEIYRASRKVTKIRFKLGRTGQNDKSRNILPVDDEIAKTLKEVFSLSEDKIRELTLQFEPQYIQDKVNQVLSSNSFLAGKIKGLAGYLITALKEDHKPGKSSNLILSKHRLKKERKEKEEVNKVEKRELRYQEYVDRKIKRYTDTLSNHDKESVFSDYKTKVLTGNNTILTKWYKQYGLEHPAVKAEFKDFLRKNRVKEIGDIMTFSDFLKLVEDCN